LLTTEQQKFYRLCIKKIGFTKGVNFQADKKLHINIIVLEQKKK